MEDRTGELATALERLTSRLAELECRITALETAANRLPETSSAPIPAPDPSRPDQAETSVASANLITILGKSILGIAGAYLLRAAAETTLFPKFALVLLALLYAWLWQVVSVRAGNGSRAAAGAYALTSAFILYPMLWESTVGFKLLPPPISAGVLVSFVISALLLGKNRKTPATVWVTGILSPCTALCLLVASGNPLPFLLALVSTAALVEWLISPRHLAGLRYVIAVPVNLSFLVLIHLAGRPEGFPPEYVGIPKLTLLAILTVGTLIYAAGAVLGTVRFRDLNAFTQFAQTAASFVLLWVAVLYLGGAQESKVFGGFCLFFGTSFYLCALFVDRIRLQPQRFQIFASWAVSFVLIGSVMALPPGDLVALLGAGSVGATALAWRSGRTTWGVHGLLFLIGAQVGSRGAAYGAELLAGGQISAPSASFWWMAVCAVSCSLILVFSRSATHSSRILRYCSFANSALFLTAFTVLAGSAGLGTGSAPGSATLALIRTVSICAVTLLMAVGGSVRRMKEMVWVAYTLLGLGTVKLVFEDLRLDSTGSFALSLLAFGIVLALVPRIVRSTRIEA